MSPLAFRRVGDRSLLLDLADDADPVGVAGAVRQLAETVRVVVQDVVPGATTVLAIAPDSEQLQRLAVALPQLAPVPSRKRALQSSAEEISVRYEGPDLTAVAEACGIEVDEVVRRHTAADYRAAFTGFAPGFAYLAGLDDTLRLPRRATPRSAVPAGAVAIADAYTAVYPRASPGGWHLLGTTDAVMFDPERTPPALLTPGTRVRFVAQP